MNITIITNMINNSREGELESSNVLFNIQVRLVVVYNQRHEVKGQRITTLVTTLYLNISDKLLISRLTSRIRSATEISSPTQYT